MKELVVNTRKMVNGESAYYAIDTQMLRLNIRQVHFNYPARLIIYQNEHAAKLEFDGVQIKRQISQIPSDTLVQTQFISTFDCFDYDDTTRKGYRSNWMMIWPHWLPVNDVITDKGKLHTVIEARSGSSKFKINFKIRLVVD